MNKTVILCADDFGQNREISDRILTLIKKKRLSATTCLTTMPYWPTAAKLLLSFKDDIQIGLHFNLTDGNALTKACQPYFGSLAKLIARAFSYQLNIGALEAELKAQLDAFYQRMGFLPHFIDGHQHIHHLPIVRDALLNVYKEYFPQKEAYIRISSNPFSTMLKQSFRCFKTAIISLTGALTLKKKLIHLNISHNTTFSGIYHFSKKTLNYRRLFRVFLTEIHDNGLIMCHPGSEKAEFDYFNNDELLEDLEKSNCIIKLVNAAPPLPPLRRQQESILIKLNNK